MIQAWRCTKPGIWSQMKTDLHLNTSSWPHAKLISIYTVEEHRYLERDCWQTASSSQAERYPREIILSQERKELQIFNVFTIRFTFCMQHLQKPGSIQLESKAIATHDLKTSVGLSKNTVERLKTGQERGNGEVYAMTRLKLALYIGGCSLRPQWLPASRMSANHSCFHNTRFAVCVKTCLSSVDCVPASYFFYWICLLQKVRSTS